jgi:hypothetical protein
LNKNINNLTELRLKIPEVLNSKSFDNYDEEATRLSDGKFNGWKEFLSEYKKNKLNSLKVDPMLGYDPYTGNVTMADLEGLGFQTMEQLDQFVRSLDMSFDKTFSNLLDTKLTVEDPNTALLVDSNKKELDLIDKSYKNDYDFYTMMEEAMVKAGFIERITESRSPDVNGKNLPERIYDTTKSNGTSIGTGPRKENSSEQSSVPFYDRFKTNDKTSFSDLGFTKDQEMLYDQLYGGETVIRKTANGKHTFKYSSNTPYSNKDPNRLKLETALVNNSLIPKLIENPR